MTVARNLFRRLRSKSRRGSILIYSVIILSVAGFVVMSLTGAVNHNVHDARRSAERMQAFYIAESGVQKVMDWFNRPAASPDPSYFAPSPDGSWLIPGTNTSKIQAEKIIDRGNRPTLYELNHSGGGTALEDLRGQVRELVISPPLPTDPVGIMARVRSVGRTYTGVESTVEVVLTTNRVPQILIPAAIQSYAQTASNGQFNVYWGEIWSRGNMAIPPNFNGWPKDNAGDPWWRARTEAWIVDSGGGSYPYADGRAKAGFASTPPTASAPNYRIPWLPSILHSQINSRFRNRSNVLQKQVLQWPTYDYVTMKTLALFHGIPIYRTTAGGNVISPEGAEMSFEAAFDKLMHADPDDVIKEDLPPLYFIDTIDGNPPAANGSNMATLRIQGGGPFFHGFFFTAANLDFGGSGNSPQFSTAERPDRSIVTINKLQTYGLWYCYGTIASNGQNTVYGSLYAERGYSGGGTWDVYYDWRLADPNRGRLGSRMRARLWNTY